MKAHIVGVLLGVEHEIAVELYVEIRSVLPEQIASRFSRGVG